MTEAGVVICAGLRRTYADGRTSRRGSSPVVALDGVDLDVRRGEFLAVLGPSGCGKTTLLRLVAGFEQPDAGTITLDGVPVAGPDVFVAPERRRVGIVVQDHALFPHLSVAGYVGFGLQGHRGEPARRERITEVLKLVGLEDLANRYPSDLSGGQQQRVAIARALAPEPRVLLLDEPFANLDAALRVRLRLEVRDILRTAGATVMLVTHDQEEALSLADRVAVMNRGRLLQVGKPQDVYQHPTSPFVARFVGEANLIEGRSDGVTLRSPIGDLGVAGAIPPIGPAVAVVRPEMIRVSPDPGGPGQVVTAAYFGHDQVVKVSCEGLTLRARMGSERPLTPGERVRVDITAGVVAFPGDGADDSEAPVATGGADSEGLT